MKRCSTDAVKEVANRLITSFLSVVNIFVQFFSLSAAPFLLQHVGWPLSLAASAQSDRTIAELELPHTFIQLYKEEP